MQRDKSRAKIRCVGGGEKKGVKEREMVGKKKGNKGEEMGRKGMEEKERRRKR